MDCSKATEALTSSGEFLYRIKTAPRWGAFPRPWRPARTLGGRQSGAPLREKVWGTVAGRRVGTPMHAALIPLSDVVPTRKRSGP